MSGHGYLGSGDGPSRDQKSDHSRIPSQAAATHVLPQALAHSDVLKSSLQVLVLKPWLTRKFLLHSTRRCFHFSIFLGQAHVKSAVVPGTRTIAPAPAVVGQSVAQHGPLSLTRLPAGTTISSHHVVTKLPHGKKHGGTTLVVRFMYLFVFDLFVPRLCVQLVLPFT